MLAMYLQRRSFCIGHRVRSEGDRRRPRFDPPSAAVLRLKRVSCKRRSVWHSSLSVEGTAVIPHSINWRWTLFDAEE